MARAEAQQIQDQLLILFGMYDAVSGLVESGDFESLPSDFIHPIVELMRYRQKENLADEDELKIIQEVLYAR